MKGQGENRAEKWKVKKGKVATEYKSLDIREGEMKEDGKE
jgi:hypothetical protein